MLTAVKARECPHYRFPATLAILLVISLASFVLAGCAGIVSGSNKSTTPALTPTSLSISSVQASPATSTAQVDWTTNVAATSAVDYGTTTSYGASTPANSSMVTSHTVALSGLTAGTLYHFRVRSTDANSNAASSPDVTFTTGTSSDTTPPTVSLSAPANGATVSATVTVSATASDNVGVASVQFQLDGTNLGSLDTTSPYSVSW